MANKIIVRLGHSWKVKQAGIYRRMAIEKATRRYHQELEAIEWTYRLNISNAIKDQKACEEEGST